MEFPVVNDISEFWFDLVPPIFLGAISLICFLWVIGKQNRIKLMKLFIDDNSNQFVEENGIYIQKKFSIKYAFMHKVIKYTGLDSIKPLVALFLVFLFFYGLNQLLLLVFQPLLTCSYNGIMYAAGVDENTIAKIWTHYPNVSSSSELYSVISELTGRSSVHPFELHYSVEAFIRFDLLCCLILCILMIFRFRKSDWLNRKVFLRLFAFTCTLLVLLAGTLLADVQRKNKDTINMCYEAYAMLEESSNTDIEIENETGIERFLSIIEKEKQCYGQRLYYGAFGLRNRFKECAVIFTDIYREIDRFFGQLNT